MINKHSFSQPSCDQNMQTSQQSWKQNKYWKFQNPEVCNTQQDQQSWKMKKYSFLQTLQCQISYINFISRNHKQSFAYLAATNSFTIILLLPYYSPTLMQLWNPPKLYIFLDCFILLLAVLILSLTLSTSILAKRSTPTATKN